MAKPQVDDERLRAAIEAGSQYQNATKYLDDIGKRTKCKWSGSFTTEGVSKELRFYSAFDVIAAQAAQAKAEMRPFGLVEARSIDVADALFVSVNMTARGDLPSRKLQEKYGNAGVHIVLQLGDSVIQPQSKAAPATATTGATSGVLYHWYDVGGMRGRCGV